MTGLDLKGSHVLRRPQVTLERLATWIAFAGAVVLQCSLLLLCYHAVGDASGAGSLAVPAAIALGGLAMIGGGRLGVRHSRPAFVRPRLQLIGENRSALHADHAETQRSAA
jgi:hypothetical protein